MKTEPDEHPEKPDIIVLEATPLIRLARTNTLPILHKIGGRIVVVDLVYHEMTHEAHKPYADALKAWVRDGQNSGANHPVRVEQTEMGRIFELAQKVEPLVRMKDGGETAIIQGLAETIEKSDRSTIVLSENGKTPEIVRSCCPPASVNVLTIRAFFELAERNHFIASADALINAS